MTTIIHWKHWGVLFFVALWIAPPTHAQTAPHGLALLYWSGEWGEVHDLYRWEAGKGSTLVAEAVGVDATAGVIGGDWLYFSMQNGEALLDTYRMPLDGSLPELVLSTPAYDIPFAVTEDEAWVIVGGYSNALKPQTYRVNTANLTTMRLADSIRFDYLPLKGDWLLGKRIEGDDAGTFVRLNINTREVFEILPLDENDFRYSRAQWASDGSVWFMGRRNEANSSIFRIQPDGSQIDKVLPLDSVLEEAYWSPDEQWVALVWIGGNYHLYLQALGIGGRTLDHIPSNAYFMAWQPDSKGVMLQSEGQLVLQGLDDSWVVVAPNEVAPAFATWLPEGH
ncbi:MAG: DUF5050 domain-containing protein [Anaerolineae bacterium]|nr:DUF5050 domain-containing protein [Anaerolineae bacterium]